MNNESLIEALLFSRAEPWEEEELIKNLKITSEELSLCLTNLEASLVGRGICLVRSGSRVTLGTNKQASELLAKIYKEELEKGLSKASIETLSIVMYGNFVTRGKIDYIRGVNSSFILRSLLVRGLIERKVNPNARKSFYYIPTPELLSNFGVTNITELSDYEKINSSLTKAFENASENYESEQSTETTTV